MKKVRAYRREAARGHAVTEQGTPRLAETVREDRLILEAYPDPECKPHDRGLAVVNTVLDGNISCPAQKAVRTTRSM